MPLINLLKKLNQAYPDINFVDGDRFAWLPQTKTVTYIAGGEPPQLLHEVGHAILGHADYDRDIQLINMERAAWDEACKISGSFHVEINEDLIEDHLDTYRDWLHARSTCPNCKATGFQKGNTRYACPACTQEWTVNEARICQLRRTKV